MQRYFAKDKKDNMFLLDKTDLHHIKNVMRMKDNEEIEVVYDEKLYRCRVNINEEVVINLIEEKDVAGNSSIPKISIIIPVLKENKMDYILQKSTELGVSEIIPIITERTLVKVNEKEDKKLDRWKRICKEASEQSMRVTIPNITNVKRIKDLNDIDGAKIVCSTFGNVISLKKFLQTSTKYDKIYIVVGPEGGLSKNEEEILNKMGFISISLGSNILRVETVPLSIISMINYEYME